MKCKSLQVALEPQYKGFFWVQKHVWQNVWIFLPRFTLDNFHERVVISNLSSLTSKRQKKTFNCHSENAALLAPRTDLCSAQPEVSITSGEGDEVLLLQKWNDPSYYLARLSRLARRACCLHHSCVSRRSEFTVASRNLRGIIVLTRLRPRMVTRWFTSCRDALLSWPRITQRRARPASQRNWDSLACIPSCAAHNSWGLDYFVRSVRSILSLGLIIATTHFGLCYSIRHGVTFVSFKGKMLEDAKRSV